LLTLSISAQQATPVPAAPSGAASGQVTGASAPAAQALSAQVPAADSQPAAPKTLNNDSVIKLVKAGLSDDLIISTVNAQAGNYDVTPDGLIALKGAGVSDKVVAAIVAEAAAPVAPAATDPPARMEYQGAASSPPTAATASPLPQPGAKPELFHSTDGKVRVYITDHPIFESNGIARAGANGNGAYYASAKHAQSGDDPRVVEVEADILKVCPPYVVASNNQDRSDLVLVFRRRGGARSSMFAFGGLEGLALSGLMKVDGASLFENTGDMVYATKKGSVESAIRDVCEHIPAPAAK